MLAYAPTRHRQPVRPTALLVILAGHAAVLALVLAAKMDVPLRPPPLTTIVDSIALPEPPKPDPVEPQPPAPSQSQIDTVTPVVPQPVPAPFMPEPALPAPQPGPIAGSGLQPVPDIPSPAPTVRTGPVFRTPADSVRPPYPDGKRAAGEEATLRLRLSIDARGRVVAVDPVGKADPAFLAAARRHILRAWRYAPATEGDRAIASTTTVTLRFELDG